MSDEQNAGGASTANAGGAQSGNVQDSKADPTISQGAVKVVAFDDHKRALDDLHKFKRSASEAQLRADELERKMKEIEDQKLVERNEFKTLYERERDKSKELEGKYNSLTKNLFDDRKYNEVRAAALKAGLRPEAETDLELLDLNGVAVERTDKGRIIIHGAGEFVDDLKKKRPYWFQDSKVPNFNGGGANPPKDGAPRELTAEYMVELENKKRRGDKEAAKLYQELMPKYAEQARRRKMGLPLI